VQNCPADNKNVTEPVCHFTAVPINFTKKTRSRLVTANSEVTPSNQPSALVIDPVKFFLHLVWSTCKICFSYCVDTWPQQFGGCWAHPRDRGRADPPPCVTLSNLVAV